MSLLMTTERDITALWQLCSACRFPTTIPSEIFTECKNSKSAAFGGNYLKYIFNNAYKNKVEDSAKAFHTNLNVYVSMYASVLKIDKLRKLVSTCQ